MNDDRLGPARSALVAAELADTAAERYLQAHLAALRVAAAILAARAHAASAPRLRNVWQVVAEVAPEFAEWAAYFAATQGKRQAVGAGATALVGSREADDLIRDAQAFHDAVARRLSAPRSRARGVG
ncbi:MAG: SAV_6107 family HEPN domain-containing protein [Propionicimonas sp.]